MATKNYSNLIGEKVYFKGDWSGNWGIVLKVEGENIYVSFLDDFTAIHLMDRDEFIVPRAKNVLQKT